MLQDGGQRVQALENRPEQDWIDVWHLKACSSLAGDRDMVGQLSWTATHEYAMAHGLSEDEADELHAVLQDGLGQLREWRDKKPK